MSDGRGLDAAAASGLFTGNSDAIYQLDADGRFINGNEALSAFTGYDAAALGRLRFRDLIHPDDLERIEAEFAAAFRGERRRYQTRVVASGGRILWADVTKLPVLDGGGAVSSVLGIARDLEPLRTAALENDRVTTLLRIASRLNRIAGWSLQVSDWTFTWSPELYALLDADPSDGSPEELAPRLIAPDQLVALATALEESVRTGGPIELLVTMGTMRGRTIVVQVVGEAVRDGDGDVVVLHGGFADVSTAVAAQEEMLRAERRLRATLDQIPNGIAFIDRDWRFTFLNRTAQERSGISIDETSSHTIWDLFPELADNPIGRICHTVMAGGEPGMARAYLAALGAWLEVSISSTDDGIAAVVRDVTGDQRRRDQLAAYTLELESQAALIQATNDAMIVTTLEGRIESWNAGAERLYGWSRDEVLGHDSRELLGGDITDELRNAMRERGTWVGELHTHGRDGRDLVVQTRLQVLRDDGEPRGVLRVDSDITDQFADREEARRLERRLQATLDQINDGFIIFDHDWRVTFVNDAGERFMRRSRTEAIGANIWELFPGLEGTVFADAYRRTMEERVLSTVEGYYEELGTWFEVTVHPTAEGIMIYYSDVSERQAVRAEIEAQNSRLRVQGRLLDAARDAILVRDLDHVVTYWNRAAADLYGWEADEVLGRSIVDLTYADRSEFDAAHQHVLTEGYWTGELHQRTSGGASLIVDCSWQLIYDDEGRPSAVFAVNSDVTESRKAQEQSIRAQSMESLGTLAGGIAHDLNNVLTPILMSVQLLRGGETDPTRLTLLDTMDAGVKRGADMIRQVLSFARGIEGERAVLAVEDLLAEVVAFCRDTLPKSIVSDVAIADPLWTVVGDRTQLMQVLINLVTNARDAMPDGGTISIRAHNNELDEGYQSVTQLAPPGRYVTIDIEDDGEGMTADVLSKIFEPFFTTKPHGAGTGLGLPTSMAIIRSHGGHMQVYSEPGNGTRFQLYLPAADVGKELPTPPPQAHESPPGRGELVLIVDDEAAIRQLVSQTLVSHGYRTLQASNGREAVDLLESGGFSVDVVLTDMMMPVMDGPATVRYLVENHPGIVVVAASGLNANGGVAKVRDLGVAHFIAKPFTTDALLVALREALDGR